MNYENITVISFGLLGQDILRAVSAEVAGKFYLPVIARQEHLDLSEFYDPSRRQYNGNSLLKKIDDDYSADSCKTLGLFSVDLFIPILTYIFGQAYLNGRAGIASLYRLSNERYGISKDDDLLVQRFGKEVIHELGHMFGLTHCTDPICVMRSSTYVEDIDQKESGFCRICKRVLDTRLQIPPR
ncbi:MAG: archaemetzincin family Zn-dependent metalloprotease [Bacteroidales bacterium]|nr:archaemetzincin family Zn-dependent metalloprotease [Bacteroidales bacterium]